MRDATLCFLVRGDPPQEVLLGFKKKGFGAGKRNGIGGKIEDGESVVRAAAREMYEETGVRVAEADLQPVALLIFMFPPGRNGIRWSTPSWRRRGRASRWKPTKCGPAGSR